MIGLVGAHRVGKSYLVKELIRGPYKEFEVSISKWQKELGFDSSNMSYDWETRKKIQSGLLNRFQTELQYLTKRVTRAVVDTDRTISERTPLDLIGYAYLNAPANPTEDDLKWLYDYTARCIRTTNKHYDKVILIQPGINFVYDPKSASEDSVATLHAHYLNVFLDLRLEVEKHVMPEHITDIQERVNYVLGVQAWNTTGSQQ